MTSWSIGSLLGAIAGWKGGKSKIGKAMGLMALVLSNIPYYLLAIIMVFLLAYLIPIFPPSGGYTAGRIPSLSLEFILDVIYHSILPALCIIISGMGWWFLSMRSLIVNIKSEDFIILAEAKGLPDTEIMRSYALRNSLLPQVTGLAMALGNIFSGALLTEIIFAYPGIGWKLYTAIVNLDYTVIQGAILFIVLSVSTATFIVDVIYPLIDPRVRR
ncbi:MAG: ABC transporter permease [Candidatus Bathyarchaeota archaeon]|nr:ABC transporter permease [Candidatus Bathyarchaeota archaeon]